jgi:hypothetical protein
MRLRARRIQRAVAGLALTLFVTAFLIVYVQLASGHDPALVANAAKRRESVTSASQSSATDTSESTSNQSTGSESTSSSGSSGREQAAEASTGAAAVTTSQS